MRFVIELPTPEEARRMEPVRAAAEAIVRKLPGVGQVSVVLTAHGPAQRAPAPPAGQGEPPSLTIGRHPTPQQGGPQKVTGVDRILAIASGKGGVGKSTVPRTSPSRLRGRGGGSGCWMPTSTGRRSRA